MLRLVEDGWYEGVYHGKQGVFPSNYVERISEITTTANNNNNIATTNGHNVSNESISNSSLAENDISNEEKKKNKKVLGIGFGDIFSGKQIELKTKENFNNSNGNNVNGNKSFQSPTILKKSLNDELLLDSEKQTGKQTNNNNSSSNGLAEKKRPRAKVLYEYLPTQPDELKLSVGELIFILDKNLEDEGWWKGESASTGQIGVFPDNFVEEIPAVEQPLNGSFKKKNNGNGTNNNVVLMPQSTNTIAPETTSSAPIGGAVPIHYTDSQSSSLASSSSTSSSNNSLPRATDRVLKQPATNLLVAESAEPIKLDQEAVDDANSKLTHIKKARQFNKRPPSFRNKSKEDKSNEESGAESTQQSPTASAEHSILTTVNGTARENHQKELANAVNKKLLLSESRNQTPSPMPPSYSASQQHHNSSTSVGLIDDIGFLKQELESVRKNSTQIQNDYRLVQAELVDMKRVHEEQMRKMQKRLQDMVTEIDEEKKTRLALQVELERLKKTIMNSQNS